MKKRVFLISGFQEARALAKSLVKSGYDVTVVSEDYGACRMLAEMGGATVIYGDGSKPYILDDADAWDADVAIAMTSLDESNLVICELCKKKFRVKKTIAIVGDPKKIDFFYKMGVDSVVCTATVITSIIEQ